MTAPLRNRTAATDSTNFLTESSEKLKDAFGRQKCGEPDAIKQCEKERCLAAVKREIALRRRRGIVFADTNVPFGEPSWDVLLWLYVTRQENGYCTVTSAAPSAGIPGTTLLRCLSVLSLAKLIDRSEDPFDRRRSLLHLTDKGHDLITRCFVEKMVGS